MYRNDWNGVFSNQDKILKQLRPLDNKIFLAGGTGLQRFVLKKPYRHSEDLDFFLQNLTSKKELDNIKDEIITLLGYIKKCKLEDIRWIKDEISWRMWYSFEDNHEIVKLEILNFTAQRIKDKTFLNQKIFRTENRYNLLLYKIKALCDRPDTIKDLFDIYFLLRDLGRLNIDIVINDVNKKFQQAIKIKYTKTDVINALSHHLEWDIQLSNHIKHTHDLQLEIGHFQEMIKKAFLNDKFLDFSYGTRFLKNAQEFNLSINEYMEYIEENNFLVNEWENL